MIHRDLFFKFSLCALLLVLVASCAAPPVLEDQLCIPTIDSCKPGKYSRIGIDTAWASDNTYSYRIELLPAPANTYANDHALVFYGQGKDRIALVTNDSGAIGMQHITMLSSPGYLPIGNAGEVVVTNAAGFVGTPVVSQPDKKLYLTIKSATEDPSDYDVFVATQDQQKQWTSSQVPSVHMENVFDAQPALSADGKRMYFVSERPGGTGGVDIWMSTRASPESEWRTPQPLHAVNTLCNELSPSVSYDGKWLYFASNGHETVGGYDIFRAQLDQSGIPTAPENIGRYINTEYDELFPYQSADSLLYYSSDQPAKFERRNLYVLHRSRKTQAKPGDIVADETPSANDHSQDPTIRVEGNVVVLNDTGNVDAEVFWRDPKKDVELGRKQTDTAGKYTIDLPRDKEYDIGAESKDKFYDVRRVDTRNLKDSVLQVPTLIIGDTLILRINFPFDNYTDPYDFTVGDDGEQTSIRWQSHLEIITRSIKKDLKHLKQVLLFGHTDTVGTVEYNDKLARNRGEFICKQLIKRGIPASVVVVDPKGELQPLIKREEESLETYHLRLRRVEIVKILK